MKTKIKEKETLISFILDETGSMQSVKSQTISGFNEYIETLQKDKTFKKAKYTLTKFNSGKIEIVHAGVEIGKVALLSDATYQPINTTPLYDAIGRTIQSIKSKGSVLMVIQTDGQENSSVEFSQRSIFDLITEKKKKGWTFAFLGADMDAYAASSAIGIARGNTANYTGAKINGAMRRVAEASINHNMRGFAQTDEFFQDDAVDTPKKKKPKAKAG